MDYNNRYQPLVSIIIPAYNASKYLSEAIDSALAQTYPNVEIIVVNDGSKDGGATERVALSYEDRIRYISKDNGGSSSALNVGIANMSGEWFSWLSHDDLYTPYKLEKQMDYIRHLILEGSDISKHVFFSASEQINAEGRTIKMRSMGEIRARAEAVEGFHHNGYLIAKPTTYSFHGCSCLLHKSVFADVGCFDEKLRLLNDVDFWFRLYAAGYKIHYIPEVLVKGRVHAEQVSKRIGYSYHNTEQDMYWSRSLDWLIDNYPNDSQLLYMFGKNAYLKTRNAEGDRAFERIREINPRKQLILTIVRIGLISYACAMSCLKKIYLYLKV